MDKKFCAKCGIRIKEDVVGKMFGAEPGAFEYKDGWRCARCHKKR